MSNSNLQICSLEDMRTGAHRLEQLRPSNLQLGRRAHNHLASTPCPQRPLEILPRSSARKSSSSSRPTMSVGNGWQTFSLCSQFLLRSAGPQRLFRL
jgi:hypothetical protein